MKSYFVVDVYGQQWMQHEDFHTALKRAAELAFSFSDVMFVYEDGRLLRVVRVDVPEPG